ncbi:hypothetical protein TNCV_4829511 [Trichonephila clavipes]|nr:hypothetical protein TNCV_4829511 [Trichonephila clavipes]
MKKYRSQPINSSISKYLKKEDVKTFRAYRSSLSTAWNGRVHSSALSAQPDVEPYLRNGFYKASRDSSNYDPTRVKADPFVSRLCIFSISFAFDSFAPLRQKKEQKCDDESLTRPQTRRRDIEKERSYENWNPKLNP